ncbi:MAG: DnaD domain protein [Thermomicrobiales bacterium]|nr:DnaD domain protein [Thermomicrobiales bacterium]
MPANIPIPLAFLREVVPVISSPDELHASLALFRLAAEAGSYEIPIAEATILSDAPLRRTLQQTGPAATLDRRIFDALELAVGRSTFLRVLAHTEQSDRAWYYVNTPDSRALVQAMQNGTMSPPQIIWDGKRVPQIAIDPPNAFRLYEQNIGPLTPIIADQITLAASEYPAEWIEDAIAEAVSYNKRNWRYILRILENWKESGRSERN